MSAAETETSTQTPLKELQCHFTWNINLSRASLRRTKDILEDVGTDERNCWLGHIYNLQGFIHYHLGFFSDARRFLCKAAETFCQIRNTESDDGPWLMVNYGNQAWLHHRLGEEAESRAYLTKVGALRSKYPPPSQEELHAEVYAEKAWTLMKFSREEKLLAADCFQRAIRMQPDRAEWRSSHALVLVNTFEHRSMSLDDLLEKMRTAKVQDPENLYLAAVYLEHLANKGEQVEDEAHDLAQRILRNPVSSYSGMRVLLKVYKRYISPDKCFDLAEEALKKHPENMFLKKCAANSYKYMILEGRPPQSLIDRAVSLHQELISRYPDTSVLWKLNLARIHAKNDLDKAEQVYQELLESDLEPEHKQVLYNQYAKHLFFNLRDSRKSINYHKRAAAIPVDSKHRRSSSQELEKNERRRGRR